MRKLNIIENKFKAYRIWTWVEVRHENQLKYHSNITYVEF